MYAFTDEQHQLRETVSRFLSDSSTTQNIRNLMDSDLGYEPDVFKSLVQDLGLGGVHVPEEYGGAGLSYVELCIVLEELGRNLLPSPYLASCVLATNVLLQNGTQDQRAEWLPLLVSGQKVATVAIYENDKLSTLTHVSQAVVNGKFSGSKHFVIDGANADILILTALDAGNVDGLPRFWLVDASAPGINRSPVDSIDSTRQLARIDFEDVAVEPIGVKSTKNSLSHYLDTVYVALANEMVGGAQALLDSAVEYSKTRVQFGRTIGSMQAIKHKCADLLLEVELARSAAYVAAHSVSEKHTELLQHACIAKACANDAYMKAAADAIQVHGGIGFTWDNDTHLWFKRAKSSQVLFGVSEFHRDQLIQRMATSLQADKESIAV